MKKWKEAASVILTVSTTPSCTVGACSGSSRDYNELSKEKPDFQILALKKSSESPLLPGSYVFPGGTVNVADSSDDWISLFRNYGHSIEWLCKRLNNSNTNLRIFENDSSSLPRCISLRITAIRETFEESGVLLCKTAAQKFSTDVSTPVTTNHLEIDDIDCWRNKVLSNPSEFFNLCRHNDCYPDVVSLYLWSNWLTPSHIPLRFNSAFFIAILQCIKEGTQDDYEIESLKWISADDLLLEFYHGLSRLYYPQLYEVSRIARFKLLTKLAHFAVQQNGIESEIWMPVRIFAKDGEITLLPGDDLYPKEVDYITPYAIISEDAVIASYERKRMHRMIAEKSNPHYIKLVISNVDDIPFKHILPLSPPIKGKL